MKAMILCCLTLCLLLTTACNNMAPDALERPVATLAERLGYEQVRPGKDHELITLPALVQANPRFRSELTAPAAGKVVAILVTEGQWIEPQTPLARLQIPGLTGWRDLEKAALQQLKAAEEKSKLENQKLELGIGTRDLLQTATSEEAAARMELTRIQASRQSARSSGLKSDSQSDLTFTWQSSGSGVITRIFISDGQSVAPEVVAFSMVDTAGVEVVVQVPERLLDQVGTNPQLQWFPSAAGQNDESLILPFSRAGATVDPDCRAVAYYFTGIPAGRGDTQFLPGRGGRGSLLTSLNSNSWRVSSRAICRTDGRDGVFVAGPDPEKPQWVQVQVLGRRGEDILIQSHELNAEDRVVVRGTFLLESILLLNEES